ncbi:MAG: PfkB family carbohydrate kinase [Chromatiales bacterium]|jgi:fructokinase
MTSTNKRKGRPLIIGEVLFDRFPDGSEVLGGAPFNVAWHLQGFGLAPMFVSRIGDDAAGERVRETMADWDMDLAGLQIDPTHPTGAVDIALQDGQPSFDILADQAYDHLDAEAVRTTAAGIDTALIYHGTLILRSPASRAAVDALIEAGEAPVFTDVNLRPPWWRAEDLPGVLQGARWAKLNDDELETIAALTDCTGDGLDESAHRLRERFGLEVLVLTRGAAGAGAFTADAEPTEVSPRASGEVVDTVGAGDGFASVIVLGLLSDWPLDLTMRRAQDFASRIVQQRGATRPDHALYSGLRESWGLSG